MFLFLLACQQKFEFSIPADDPSQEWEELLKEISTDNGVDYRKLQEKQDVLENYLGWIGDNGPRMSKIKRDPDLKRNRENREITFYVNAYNAWILYSILQEYPSPNLEELHNTHSDWFADQYKVDGEFMSLGHLKEARILADFQEPLLHIMLFDGSVSSPSLQYWDSSQLDFVLSNRMRNFLSKQGSHQQENTWEFSSLFQQEENDFIYWSKAENICQYLLDYSSNDLHDWLKENQENCSIQFMNKDWKLFEAKND